MTAFQELDEAAAQDEHVAEPPPHSVTPPRDEPSQQDERAAVAVPLEKEPVEDVHTASSEVRHSSLGSIATRVLYREMASNQRQLQCR